jgi:hypothetical protein
LTIYSNEQTVNLSRQITVAISGSVSYEGIIQSTVRTFLLEDSFGQDTRTLYPASLPINVPVRVVSLRGTIIHRALDLASAVATHLGAVARRLGVRARREA